MSDSGVYIIEVARPQGAPLLYVGRAVSFRQRWQKHRSDMACGRANIHLRRAWSKYGSSAFTFRVLERCAIADLEIIEQWWLDLFTALPICLNIAKSSRAPWVGEHRAPETRKKISLAHKGKILSPEHRRSISAGGRGIGRSAQTRARISAATLGERNSMWGKTGRRNGRSRGVEALCLETGEVVATFDSMTLAERAGYEQSAISRTCSGKTRFHRGLGWRYAAP